MIGDVDDCESQHLCRRVFALGSAFFLEAVSAFEVVHEHLEQQLERTAVVVVEGRAGHARRGRQVRRR